MNGASQNYNIDLISPLFLFFLLLFFPVSITFLYQLVAGLAARSYGLNVARLAGIPADILELATSKSEELEKVVARRRLAVTRTRCVCACPCAYALRVKRTCKSSNTRSKVGKENERTLIFVFELRSVRCTCTRLCGS